MHYLLIAIAASAAWAVYAYVRHERAGRVRWREMAGAPVDVGEAPYRHASFETRLEAAPTLVRVTAFACLLLGPAVAGVLLLPSFFLKPITVATNASEPMGTIQLSTLVYRLGPALLMRADRVHLQAEMAIRVVRIIVGVLVIVAVFGFTRGTAVSWIAAAFATLLFALTSLLARVANSVENMTSRVAPVEPTSR
jgi:hypothetical protein